VEHHISHDHLLLIYYVHDVYMLNFVLLLAQLDYIIIIIPLFSVYSFTGVALECRKSRDTII